ncbi:MAG: hypothetical protein LUE97_08495 [Oscillospiraceae bacterium]|nr:hypothetical protein [Oscillospiraceae bacterium]
MSSKNVKELEPVKVVKINSDLISPSPKAFEDYGSNFKLSRFYYWYSYHETAESNPIFGIRVMTPNAFATSLSQVQLGELLTRQTVVPISEPIHQPSAAEYTRSAAVQDAWEMSGSNPDILVRFTTDGVRVVEGERTDLIFTNLPFNRMLTPTGVFGEGCFHILQPCRITGTLDGKPVDMFGGWDKFFGTQSLYTTAAPMGGSVFVGVCPDGKLEYCDFSCRGGDTTVVYCKEGEEPVYSDNVKTSFKWVKQPYTSEGTYVPAEFDLYFEGKELHFKAKWGCHGNTEQNMDVPGFAQCFGTFYMGKTPYKHKKGMAMMEFWAALKDNLVEYGYMNK